ncbi:MAG: xanthine dehydrogenase family protein subunit M [Actinobacteria bacterium]|nr:MAG: xanthine dehydrogenase family protein subunit M [Actinomycetota bacterium]
MNVAHPTTLGEAVAAMGEGATALAGGTDLMVEVNFGHTRPENVVALRRVEELAQWEGGRIGAGVTWRRLERDGPRALAQAARTVGSPQIRNAGTLGGNVGTASPAGDGLPFLAAVDASIELASESGRRTLRWDDFFIGVKKTARRPDELISAIQLPEALPDRQEFAKIGVRNAMVIATVYCVVTRAEDGETRVALGSVAPTTIRARRAEELISSVASPGEEDLREFARLVSEEVTPITDHRSTEQYRRHSSGVLARRLLERCLR